MALTNADYRRIGQGGTPPKGYTFKERVGAVFLALAPAAALIAIFYRLADV